jgi:predicted dehydrogenase
MQPVKLIIIGAGQRGAGYAAYAGHFPEQLQIVGVAEPRDFHRKQMMDEYRIPPENAATDWTELAARDKFADGAVVSTQDAMHADPAVALAAKGYHLLVEKPLAPTEEECKRIVAAATENGVMLAVGHVLRYTSYTRRLKALIDAGKIGDIVNIQRMEPVGFWHQAHSYVRGNWRNAQESSSMLLAKSCHDIDWIRYIMGSRCASVSSFGSLKHFKAAEKPDGAASRCVDCDCESDCPYSAIKIYMGRVKDGHTDWPVSVLTPEVTEECVLAALRDGPYGRCVYECDNDVVDNQVVNMMFEDGQTASFTMTCFNKGAHRETHVFGTRGHLYGNGSEIRHYDFLSGEEVTIDTNASDSSILGGHGGGDLGLMESFVTAIAQNDPTKILSGADESLESHLMVFAAERARIEHRVVDL